MSRAGVEFKRRMLRLLKEDEEFRYAVMGLLGVEDIRSGQARLEEAVERLTEAQARTEQAIAQLVERQGKLEEAMARLADGQGKLEEAMKQLAERQDRLEERQARLEEAMIRLAEGQARLEERQDRLEEAMTRLAEAQARLEERQGKLEEAVARLAEGQARLEERQDRLEEAVARLAEAQARTEIALQELSRHVTSLSETIGFGLEDIARVVVPGWLYRHEGIVVDNLVRRFFVVDGEEVEVNLYGEGTRNASRVIILGEAKARIYEGDVKNFGRAVEKVSPLFAEEVYKLMFGYYVHPSAEKEAKNRGITLIASYMR